MNKNTILAVLAVMTLVLATIYLTPSSTSSAESTTLVLIDKGNGQTYWSEESGTTLDGAFESAFSAQKMTFSSSGSVITVDGNSSIIIGGVACSWKYYRYEDGWVETTYSGGASCPSNAIAVGYYPDGYAPTVTPAYKTAWTMIHADSLNSGSITNYDPSEYNAELVFTYDNGEDTPVPACYASPLYANGHVYFLGAEYGIGAKYCHMIGFNCSDGTVDWDNTYPVSGLNLSTGCIYGDSVYFSSTTGFIYRIPLSGENAGTVTDTYKIKTYPFPSSKSAMMLGASSIIYNSGHLYIGSSSGELVCLTPDLKEVWKTDIAAAVYPSLSVSVTDGYVYAGGCDGKLYILDQTTGDVVASRQLYTRDDGEVGGRVGTPAVLGEYIIVSYNDGLGIDCETYCSAVLKFDHSKKELTMIKDFSSDLQIESGYLVISPTNGFVYGVGYVGKEDDCLYRIYIDGTYDKMFEVVECHGGYTLVNNTYFYGTDYYEKIGETGGSIRVYNMSGEEVGHYDRPDVIKEFSMTPTVIAGQYIFATTDSGAMVLKGTLVDGKDPPEPTPPKPEPSDTETNYIMYVLVATIVVGIAITVFVYLRQIKTNRGVSNDIDPQMRSKVRQNQRKLLVVCTMGLGATCFMFVVSIAVGPSVSLSLPDALSALTSAIHKHGQGLDPNEIYVYQSRLPRAIAVVAVGIGLSIAGCVYQAIIRNPLVDPYIMGVSSGAGTFAVAAIAANFTFFGLLSNNNFATPILATMGGLIAFGLTLLIAEKAGGSSTNYVLAGVVIGLVFSAAQTLLLVTASTDKLNSAISWLFGSFANVGWDTVWIIFFPALFLAIVPLFWAKELNLVLLGEDQAKQMGLNVRKFNRWMLILASVLTSVCVAFVGIIGFVGMVIPHLCRMILGGDHRLVLPASIMMGGALMLLADLMAKMLMIPTELPVGAITTIIGVPVFAYLLIKKGRMYSG